MSCMLLPGLPEFDLLHNKMLIAFYSHLLSPLKGGQGAITTPMSDYSDDDSDGLTQDELVDLLVDEIRERHAVLAGEQTQVEKVQRVLESLDDKGVAGDLAVVKAYLAMTQGLAQQLQEVLNRVQASRETASIMALLQEQDVEDESRTGMLSVDEPVVNTLAIDGEDYDGEFVWIETKKFGTRKFYPALPHFIKYIGDDWEFPADFGSWCSVISGYCGENKYDNVVLGDSLTADEEEALRIVLKETIKKCFRLNLDYSAKATQLYQQIQGLAKKHYTRAVKDDEWKKLRVDSDLSDAMEYIEGVREIKSIELSTQNKDEQIVDDAFLSKKLLETLPSKMRQKILRKIPPEALATDSFKVQLTINMYLEKRFPVVVMNPRRCPICDSACHAERCCPFRKRGQHSNRNRD